MFAVFVSSSFPLHFVFLVYIFYDFIGPETLAGCMFILSMPSTMDAYCVVLYRMHKKYSNNWSNFLFLNGSYGILWASHQSAQYMHIKYMHINIRVWGRKNKVRDCDATGEAALYHLLDTGNLFLWYRFLCFDTQSNTEDYH